MPSRPFLHGVELRRKIREAQPGDVLHLEHGIEYEGPFVLDRRISLVGHGDATQLFARGGPAVVVLAPGIRLEHLGITDAIDPDGGTCLLVERQAGPVLVDVRTEGRMAAVSREQVIDLGDFLPQQQGLSFLHVEVAGPSIVSCGESSARWLWAGVGDNLDKSLPAAGHHLLRLGCDARMIGTGGLAVGELRIATGSEVRTLWVTAQVLAEQPPDLLIGDIALRLTKGPLIRFSEGFVIGRGRFPLLPAVSSLEEKQSILLREAGGVWSLFQPWKTRVPTLLNGVPLALGQRRLLRTGDRIRAAELELAVEAFRGPAAFSVASPLVDLGVADGRPARGGLQIRSHAAGKTKLTILPTVSWLHVDPSAVELKKDETRDVRVNWTDAVTSLPPTRHRERGALLIQGKNETLCVDATVEVLADFIAPRGAGSLDFGTVVDWEKAGASVNIGNGGTQVWRPAVKVDGDWLTSDCSSLTVPPGTDVALSVRLNEKVLDLPPVGDQVVTLRLEGDGALLELRVTARLQLNTGPIPRLISPPLDFQDVRNPEGASPMTVLIHNRGRRDWQAALRAVPWLEVPAGLVVPAGKQKSFVVCLNDRLPVGSNIVKDAILLHGEGKELAVEVRVCHHPVPKIRASRHRIDFGEAGSSESAVRISLLNEGSLEGSLSVRADALPSWLDVRPRSVTIPRGGKAELEVRLTAEADRLLPGVHRVERAIVLEGEGVGIPPLEVSLTAPPYGLEVEPRELLLAVEKGADLSVLRREVRLHNRGRRLWAGRVETLVPWLEVEPRQVVVAPGEALDVIVRATDEVFDLGSGEQQFGQVIAFEGLSLALGARVRIARRPEHRVIAAKEVWKLKTSSLALGGVRRDRWDEPRAKSSIGIVNSGSYALDLTVRLEEGSEAFVVPSRLRVPAGSEAFLPVALKPGAGPLLKLGPVDGRVVLEYAGESREVGIGLQLLPPRKESVFGSCQPTPEAALVPPPGRSEPTSPLFERAAKLPEQPSGSAEDRIAIDPPCLDFGTVSPGIQVSSRTVTLTNRGNRPATVIVEVRVPWLHVSSLGRLECPADSSRSFEVSLKVNPFHPKGPFHDPQAVVLAADGYSSRLAVRFETI